MQKVCTIFITIDLLCVISIVIKISNNVEEKVLQIGLIRMVGANVYFFGSEICFLCINLDKYKNCKDQHNLCSFRIV